MNSNDLAIVGGPGEGPRCRDSHHRVEAEGRDAGQTAQLVDVGLVHSDRDSNPTHIGHRLPTPPLNLA